MIDKLDLRIPRKTPFTPEFQEAYRDAASKGLLRPSQYYAQTGDFRPYGYEVRLHMFASFGQRCNSKRSHDHKLELYDTGEMKFDQMLSEISRVFVCDPLELEMLRRDVCVDVDGVSLNWFKTHARVEFKRNSREIGYMVVTARKGETFYLGERTNQFRFYNKVAERLYRYLYMLRESRKGGYTHWILPGSLWPSGERNRNSRGAAVWRKSMRGEAAFTAEDGRDVPFCTAQIPKGIGMGDQPIWDG
jgi:hypothetical protein